MAENESGSEGGYRIFIVEDDLALGEQVVQGLGRWGYQTRLVNDFTRVDEECKAWQPHLVIMDVNLPRFDGFHWCRTIRAESPLPILFASARDSDMDLVMGIGSGGDDYLAKPFSMEVLVAKIQALLRRVYQYRESESSAQLSCHGFTLHTGRQLISRGSDKVELTRHEFRILQLLMEKRGSIVSRDQLMDALWHGEVYVDDNTLTVNINRVRKRLAALGLDDIIQTRKQQGYLIP